MSRTGNLYVEFDDLVCVIWCHMISLSLLHFLLLGLSALYGSPLDIYFLYSLFAFSRAAFMLCILVLLSREASFMVVIRSASIP